MEALSKSPFFSSLVYLYPGDRVHDLGSFDGGISLLYYFLFLAAGIIVWTATEYLLHALCFSFLSSLFHGWGKRIHFIFHGVHHDYPKDAKRLVMPPSASIPLLHWFLFPVLYTV